MSTDSGTQVFDTNGKPELAVKVGVYRGMTRIGDLWLPVTAGPYFVQSRRHHGSDKVVVLVETSVIEESTKRKVTKLTAYAQEFEPTIPDTFDILNLIEVPGEPAEYEVLIGVNEVMFLHRFHQWQPQQPRIAA